MKVKIDCRVTYSYSFETEVDEEVFKHLEEFQEYGPVDADYSDYQDAVDLILERDIDSYYNCEINIDSLEYDND